MILYIFDFDDTLAHTNSHVRVIKSDGTVNRLNSREFAKYRQSPGEVLDFSEFDLATGSLINDTVNAMESAILDVGIENVYIVTARSTAEPVVQFLTSMGVTSPQVVATSGSEGKATWLTGKLVSGNFEEVMVYEDCRKNITMLRDIVEAYNEEMSKNVIYRAICILPSGTQEIIEALDYMNEGLMDYLQTGLDVVGFVPGAGEIADGINALISIARGNILDAFLSAVSLIPLAGDAVGKSGKVITKVFGPAMDIIKASGSTAEIVAKIGPDKIKKILPVIETFKSSIVKYKDEISKVLEAIIDGDVAALEKITGLEVPKMAKGKFESMLKAAGEKLEELDIETVVNFFADFSSEDLDEEGEDDETEEYDDDDVNEAVVRQRSLTRAVFGREFINQELRKLSEDIRLIRTKSRL